jgi:F-type H+-transporting ATPase subunit epsilon
MKLRITTPLDIVVDEDGVTALRAEDASGSFGILAHHADLLTSLATTVVRWTGPDQRRHFCAVRGGMLTMTGGDTIAIATREAITGDDLATMDQTVLARFRADAETERDEKLQGKLMQLNAIRQIITHLRPASSTGGAEFS